MGKQIYTARIVLEEVEKLLEKGKTEEAFELMRNYIGALHPGTRSLYKVGK